MIEKPLRHYILEYCRLIYHHHTYLSVRDREDYEGCITDSSLYFGKNNDRMTIKESILSYFKSEIGEPTESFELKDDYVKDKKLECIKQKYDCTFYINKSNETVVTFPIEEGTWEYRFLNTLEK